METKRKLKAALLDIGGTLWADVFEDRANVRVTRLAAGLPPEYRHVVPDLLRLLDEAGAEAILDDDLTSTPDIAHVIGEALTRLSVSTSGELIDAVRRAMVIPAEPGRLFPGAKALLETIGDLRLQVGAVSNTVWRNAADYWRDFETVGVSAYIDAIVTSVDCGVRKPHPKIFHEALKRLDAYPDGTILVGIRNPWTSRPQELSGCSRFGWRSKSQFRPRLLPMPSSIHCRQFARRSRTSYLVEPTTHKCVRSARSIDFDGKRARDIPRRDVTAE